MSDQKINDTVLSAPLVFIYHYEVIDTPLQRILKRRSAYVDLGEDFVTWHVDFNAEEREDEDDHEWKEEMTYLYIKVHRSQVNGVGLDYHQGNNQWRLTMGLSGDMRNIQIFYDEPKTAKNMLRIFENYYIGGQKK